MLPIRALALAMVVTRSTRSILTFPGPGAQPGDLAGSALSPRIGEKNKALQYRLEEIQVDQAYEQLREEWRRRAELEAELEGMSEQELMARLERLFSELRELASQPEADSPATDGDRLGEADLRG
jgi:hypothetical protein